MTDQLAPGDKLYWRPIPSLHTWLASLIPVGANVLDVGPGKLPFARANALVDIVKPEKENPDQPCFLHDVSTERLPWPDKHFDFVYCRHTLEDMADPFSAMREIERVGKAGYIETPSPIAELCRGVDGKELLPWRGYNHHCWIVWAHDGELNFVTKFSVIEHADASDVCLAEALRQGPRYWNTYHLWRDTIRFVHRKPTSHFAMPTGYPAQLTEAVRQSGAATDAFWSRMPRDLETTQTFRAA